MAAVLALHRYRLQYNLPFLWHRGVEGLPWQQYWLSTDIDCNITCLFYDTVVWRGCHGSCTDSPQLQYNVVLSMMYHGVEGLPWQQYWLSTALILRCLFYDVPWCGGTVMTAVLTLHRYRLQHNVASSMYHGVEGLSWQQYWLSTDIDYNITLPLLCTMVWRDCHGSSTDSPQT